MNFKKILTGALYEKNKNKKDAAKNVAIGASIGTALGLAAGFLFAPKSGKETRETIAKGAQKLSQEVKEKLEEASSKVKEMTSKKAQNCEPGCCDDICSCENTDDNIAK